MSDPNTMKAKPNTPASVPASTPRARPSYPVTVRFEFTAHPKIYWLVVDGPQPELCFNDPGRLIDLVVTADEETLGAVMMGRARMTDALERGQIRLDGAPALVRAIPGWIGDSRFSKYARPANPPQAALALQGA